MLLLRRALSALLLLLLVFPAAAATLNVPSSQFPTIQAGINAAAPGDTVLVADGTYTGYGNVDLDFGGKAITVASVHGAGSTLIDCQGGSNAARRGFYFHSGETSGATVQGFTIKNGVPPTDANGDAAGGAIDVIGGSSPTIAGCVLSANQNSAIAASGSSPTVSKCAFNANMDTGMGFTGSSRPVIFQCKFTNNPASGIGGDGAPTITACTFSGNGTGANINGSPVLSGCTFSGSLQFGLYASGAPTVSGCTFTANQISGMWVSGVPTVSGCAFTGNGGTGAQAQTGGPGTPVFTNCTFTGNKSIGLYASGSQLTITDCAFADNQADGLEANGGHVTVSGCTFTDNQGRGIYDQPNGGNTTAVSNCVFVANALAAITLQSPSPAVANCTFTANQTVAIEALGTTQPAITNCILWGDTGGEVSASGSSVVTLSHCDVQGGAAGAHVFSADPLFMRPPNPAANPADYGDLHLKPGSPCFGTGTSAGAPPADKDGNPRPVPPGIGAYEKISVPVPRRFDFDGDGSDDLLWHNTQTGQTLVWNMNDQTVVNSGSPFAAVADTHWTIAAVADVNGDGQPDLLWQNTQTGQVLFWLMGGIDGAQVLSYGSPIATVADTHWRIAGLSDFDGDGSPDILWENSATGQLLVWYMNGMSVVRYGSPFATVTDTRWQVVGLADFDGDGRTDLVWENSATGQALVWNMGGADGTAALAYGNPFTTVSSTAWRIVGTGDTDGDGHPDLVWQNAQSGQVLRWLMGGAAGTQVRQYGSPFATVTDTHWQIVGVH